MSLYAFTVLGMFLLVAPWSPVWEQATHALFPARLGIWVRTGWVRGLVSGLGALDLAVAFQVGRELWSAMRVAAERDERDRGGSG
jgi:hypothetical protein